MKDETNDQRTILTMDTETADDDFLGGGGPPVVYTYMTRCVTLCHSTVGDASRRPQTQQTISFPLLQDPNVKKKKKLTNITPVLIERKNKTLKQINVATDVHKTRVLATPRASSSRPPLCYNLNLLNLGFQPLATFISTISVLFASMGGVFPGGRFPGSRRTKSFKSLT